jgi:general secretion pathway protein G
MKRLFCAAGIVKENTMNKQSLRRAGFTLLELLIVLALLAVVGGFLYTGLIEKGETAKASAAKVQIASIGQALDLFKIEVGRYPNSSEGLGALVTAPGGATNWNGPYLKDKAGALPKDPWNNDFRYTSPTQSGGYELISLGADGKEGGEGANKDISNLK